MFHYSLNPHCRRRHHRRHMSPNSPQQQHFGNSRQNYHHRCSGDVLAWLVGKARSARGMNGITPALIFALRCVTFFLL
jgi:hypothetical protein